MAITAILFIVLVLIAAMCSQQGLWSCMINVVNLTMAGVVATNFFEPIARMIDPSGSNYPVDSGVLWGLFALTYIILRLITQMLSDHDVHFIKPVEYAGRTIMALWCGWLFVCFTAFAMSTAPIGGSPMGAWETPEYNSMQVFSPERQWLAFCQSRSQGALANSNSGEQLHPEDPPGCQVFDPYGEFIYRYYWRRKKSG
jgi:hypothetical protein